jgi:hypothetical protein
MRRVYNVSYKIDVYVISAIELREVIAENLDQV